MPYNFVTNIESCYYNIPHILYYSHVPTAVVSLLLGIFVFTNNKKSTSARLLLLISILFSLWSISDIIIFVSPDSKMVMFFWSIINLLEILTSIATFYFAYTFFNKEKNPPFWSKLIFGTIIASFAVLIFTQTNLHGFDILNCESMQGPLVNYFYAIEIFNFLCIFLYSIKEVIKTFHTERGRQVLLFSAGIILFSASFAGANLIGSFSALVNPDSPNNWKILQYGLFGMPIFMSLLAYIIVKYRTFNIKLIATQALVWGLVILIGSQFFFIQITTNLILNGITFVASIIFGYFLIKSIKKEIMQKEELLKLNNKLSHLLEQRESLVHLVTHKVKGSFSRTKAIFSEMLEGDFGTISEEVRKWAKRGLDSDNTGIETVDLVLNAANMQRGTVKYEMKSTDFKDIILKSATEKREQAESKGLKFETKIEPNDYNVLGDAFWLREVVNNLIDNAIRYSKEGQITVGLEKENGKITLSVKDTGIGITDEDKKKLFTEGGRGKDSVHINVDSTGYGLYSVKLITDAHKGKTWVTSEVGKGSTFFVELDAI